MAWVAYKQKTLASQRSGGWKSKIKMLADSASGENELPGSSCLSVLFWQKDQEGGVSLVSFHESSHFVTHPPLKGLTSNTTAMSWRG